VASVGFQREIAANLQAAPTLLREKLAPKAKGPGPQVIIPTRKHPARLGKGVRKSSIEGLLKR